MKNNINNFEKIELETQKKLDEEKQKLEQALAESKVKTEKLIQEERLKTEQLLKELENQKNNQK